MIQCEYLNKKFKIDTSEIKILKELQIQRELDYTEQETMNGLPQLEIKGFKPQNFSISYTSLSAVGAYPLKEYNEWKRLLGQADNFYCGDKQVGVDIFVLKQVSLSDGKLDANGNIISATIQLSLSQDIMGEVKK